MKNVSFIPKSTHSASLVDTRKSTVHYLQHPKMSTFVWTFSIFCRICYLFVNAARIKVKRKNVFLSFQLNLNLINQWVSLTVFWLSIEHSYVRTFFFIFVSLWCSLLQTRRQIQTTVFLSFSLFLVSEFLTFLNFLERRNESLKHWEGRKHL